MLHVVSNVPLSKSLEAFSPQNQYLDRSKTSSLIIVQSPYSWPEMKPIAIQQFGSKKENITVRARVITINSRQ